MKGSFMNLSKLKDEMPFRWRVQQQTERGATCVAYVDSRQVQDKLDEAVGPENWQCDYKVINDNMYAGVAIRREDTGEWIWKWDCGTESNTEKEKGEASDAFKRAAVKWGVGRFLYEMSLQKVKVKQHTNGKTYPCDDKGEILWDGDMLSDFINTKINKGSAPAPETRYEKPASEPQYATPNKSKWSKAVQDRAAKLEKNGLKGSAALLKYLPQYNERMKTSYATIQELDTDEKLEGLIKYVEDVPPTGLV
jgi:hypothetical protein